MIRKVYIIPEETLVSKYITNALSVNCGEIATGIPPKFKDFVKKKDLPMLYEEVIDPLKPFNIKLEIDKLKEEIKILKTKV